MASFNITTPVNIDSLTGKTGADTYNINGGYLTIDQDTRYGQNASTTACPLTITLSATLGGDLEFNSTKVRLIPYTSGSGNVPAYSTAISRSGASGLLIGVYANLTSAPTTPGSAMPSSGFIKVKQWNSVPFTAGALTGISATASGADKAGWLEIVLAENSGNSITVNRLNKFLVRGDWYDLGVTTGNNATVYQIPSNGSDVYASGVQVETAPGSGVFEWYPCAGALSATGTLLTDELGKACWISTSGAVRFQNDGTNSGSGYLPVSGCAVRVPNIFFTTCTVAAQGSNSAPHSNLLNRPKVVPIGGGVVDIDRGMFAWYMTFTTPFQVKVKDTGILQTLSINNPGSPVDIDGLCVGQWNSTTNQIALMIQYASFGGVVQNSIFSINAANGGASNLATTSFSSVYDFEIRNCKTHLLGARHGSTNLNGLVVAGSRILVEDCHLIGTQVTVSLVNNLTIKNLKYSDYTGLGSGRKNGNNSIVAISTNGSSKIVIDGISVVGGVNQAPTASFVSLANSNLTSVYIRNIGEPNAPIVTAGPIVTGATLTRVTTVGTVTSVGHGLVTGDYIQPTYTSATVGGVTKTRYQVTVVDADTFTIPTANSGLTSATMNYKQSSTTSVLAVTSNIANVNDLKLQRLYVEGCYGAPVSNSSNNWDGFVIENCDLGMPDLNTPALLGANNMLVRGLGVNRASLTASLTSIYGMHFGFLYLTPPGTAVWRTATWTRVVGTYTFTLVGHGLQDAVPIVFRNSSNPAGISDGVKGISSVTLDTFVVTGVSSGASSGTVEFLVPDSRMQVFMTEPTTKTAGQAAILAGARAGFTSQSTLALPDVGDTVEFVLPDYVKGITDFENTLPVIGGPTSTFFDIKYAIDKNDGAGFSSYKYMQYVRAGGSGTSGASTFTVTDATGVHTGMYAFGTGVGPNAKVTGVVGNTVTVNVANVATVSGTICFNELAGETGLDPEKGIRMKTQIICLKGNTTAINAFYWFCRSDATSRAYLYPLDMADLLITGIVPGSDIVILEPGTDNEYVNIDANGSPTYVYEYDAGEVSEVDIGVFKAGYVPFYIRNLPVSAEGGSVLITQLPDRNYVD